MNVTRSTKFFIFDRTDDDQLVHPMTYNRQDFLFDSNGYDTQADAELAIELLALEEYQVANSPHRVNLRGHPIEVHYKYFIIPQFVVTVS